MRKPDPQEETQRKCGWVSQRAEDEAGGMVLTEGSLRKSLKVVTHVGRDLEGINTKARLHAGRNAGLTPEGEMVSGSRAHLTVGLTLLLLPSPSYNFVSRHRHFPANLRWVSVFPLPRVSISLDQVTPA